VLCEYVDRGLPAAAGLDAERSDADAARPGLGASLVSGS
jgi:hypothetical protein